MTQLYGLAYGGVSLANPARPPRRNPATDPLNVRRVTQMLDRAAFYERRGCAEAALMMAEAAECMELGRFTWGANLRTLADDKAREEARRIGVSLI